MGINYINNTQKVHLRKFQEKEIQDLIDMLDAAIDAEEKHLKKMLIKYYRLSSDNQHAQVIKCENDINNEIKRLSTSPAYIELLAGRENLEELYKLI